MTITIPSLTADCTLRNVTFDSGLTDVAGHRLHTWEVGTHCSTGQRHIGYAFYASGASEPLFAGDDYGCAPSDAIDSDACLCGILSFLCLKPGDTDSEYFEAYTHAQRDWTRCYACETLSIIPYDAEPAHSNDYEGGLKWDDDNRLCDRETGEPVFADVESEG